MDGTFVKELADRVAVPGQMQGPDLTVMPPGWTVADPAAYIKPGPTADPLAAYTLAAVSDYLAANRDALDLSKLVVHVVSPQIVTISGPIMERARNREVYVKATALNVADGFLGKFMSHEEFIIGLQSRFVESTDRAAVLRLIGNIAHESVKGTSDDGITQTVQTKAGVVLKQEAAVPNPVTLAPFRTFREVPQPPSSFVLRVNQGRPGGFPEVGLFESDGGAWRLVAVERLAGWLRGALPASVAVLA
jgi:hypothetical protein